MPSRHEVSSLYELCENEFAEYFARSWEEFWIDKQGSGQFLGLIPLIPRTVANSVVVKILKFYVDRRRPGYCQICDLLSVFFNAQLSCLDLSDLVGIGPRRDNHLKEFENTLILWLPKLSQVQKLVLRTHVLLTTLPICTDTILQGIGYYIRELRVLDISKNNLVTDYGLEHLLPLNGFGCPLLEELFLFECSVTTEGVTPVIENLNNLRILGYKETGQVLKHLFCKFTKQNNKKAVQSLKLTHVNNLGAHGLINHLVCDHKFVEATRTLCPNLMNLKVRITDQNLPLLQTFTKLRVLELIYFETYPPLGAGTTEFFKISGHLLYSLTLCCPTFSSQYFCVLGEFCPNLHKLWFTCYVMVWDEDFGKLNHPHAFELLETLYLRIGFSESDVSELSFAVFQYILNRTCQLSDFRLICNSPTLTDDWLKNLWKTFNTDKLEYVLIALPFLNLKNKSLALTMLSVNFILEHSPCIRYLGNLLVWDISFQEVKNLKTFLDMCNFNVNLVYRNMKIK